MVICLERGANDLHMVQLMPLPPHHLFCFSKIQNGLSFWYRPTQVVLEKRPLNVCVLCVCGDYDHHGELFLRLMNMILLYRGENRLVGWEYRPVANVANRCLLRMIVSTDIKVSASCKAYVMLYIYWQLCNIHTMHILMT